MYLNILKKSSARISKLIENYFSFFLSQYKASEDKIKLIKQLFIKLIQDKGEEEQFVDAYEDTIAEAYLQLFYKYIWFKMKNPDVKDFGTRFFSEYGEGDCEY